MPLLSMGNTSIARATCRCLPNRNDRDVTRASRLITTAAREVFHQGIDGDGIFIKSLP